jgi:DoxX-like family
MQTDVQNSARHILIGRIITGLLVAFFLFDVSLKLIPIQGVIEANAQLGYAASTVPITGAILLLSTLLYVLPRTSFFGAILLTGYLGGAVNTHVRVGGPLFPIIFSILFGVLVWAGLTLRNDKLRSLVVSPNA